MARFAQWKSRAWQDEWGARLCHRLRDETDFKYWYRVPGGRDKTFLYVQHEDVLHSRPHEKHHKIYMMAWNDLRAGLLVEKGYPPSSTKEPALDPTWSWFRLVDLLNDDRFARDLDRARRMVPVEVQAVPWGGAQSAFPASPLLDNENLERHSLLEKLEGLDHGNGYDLHICRRWSVEEAEKQDMDDAIVEVWKALHPLYRLMLQGVE